MTDRDVSEPDEARAPAGEPHAAAAGPRAAAGSGVAAGSGAPYGNAGGERADRPGGQVGDDRTARMQGGDPAPAAGSEPVDMAEAVDAAGSSDAPDDAPVEAPAADLAPEPDPSEPDGPVAAPADDRAPDPAGVAEPAEPADPDQPAGPAEVEPIVALTQQRDDYRDALIRLQADFENYKKRMIKQQTDHLERAATALVDKLLPVLDTADLAMAHGGGEDVKQLTGALTSVLEREGLERIDPAGGPFDPTLHDAVAHEPSDDGQQEVVEVMRAGYRWKGRVLRPAMVKVRG